MSNDDEAASNLGERLLAGVRNLWKAVNTNTGDIEDLQRRMRELERQVHSLRTSRGMQIAKNVRLRADLDEADKKLVEVRERIH